MNDVLTELEQRLAQPDGAAHRDGLLLRLRDAETNLRKQLRGSLPRAEFPQAEALAAACQAAQEVLLSWPVGNSAPVRASYSLR